MITLTGTQTEQRDSLASRVIGQINQWLCRHKNEVMHFEGNRVMMRCPDCGHDTPGWEITGKAPRQRFDGDPKRHVLKETTA